MEVANTLAYYDTVTITDIKSFIVKTPVPQSLTQQEGSGSQQSYNYAIGSSINGVALRQKSLKRTGIPNSLDGAYENALLEDDDSVREDAANV
jgi:hypothetical protein